MSSEQGTVPGDCCVLSSECCCEFVSASYFGQGTLSNGRYRLCI